jgi:LPXTG-motif cell wall-anchored protein
MDITSSLPIIMGLILLVIVVYWFFIRRKNSIDTENGNDFTVNKAINTQEENKLTAEELLNKAWEFLTIIAEKVLKMSSKTQDDILNIGRKLKDNGMIFTIMVDDGQSNLPKSPAKERAAKEQKNQKQTTQQKS